MNSSRLPPMGPGADLAGAIPIVNLAVGSWAEHRATPPSAVGLSLTTVYGEVFVMRLNTPRAVDQMIQGLLRHKRDVWPDAP